MRSSWKGLFVDKKKLFLFDTAGNAMVGKNFKSLNKKKLTTKLMCHYFVNNSFTILNGWINKWGSVYNGKSVENMHFKREMLGFKVGEFVFTRRAIVSHKKKVKTSSSLKSKKNK